MSHVHSIRAGGSIRRLARRGSLLGVAAVAVAGTTLVSAPAHADSPGIAPWVVSVGDSYISGEAGRWAGSSDTTTTAADAGGPTAYFDNASHTAETINRCHRSASAEIYIGDGVNGLNLACSGAKTATYHDSMGNFKPGLDFYDNGSGQLGQAKLLQQFATTHNVKLVAASIGGNDFNFGSIVTQCVTDFLTSPSWWPNYCRDDRSVTANFTSSNVAAVQTKIANSLLNVRTAMRNAGYADKSWTLLVQNYPSPIPDGTGFRYGQSGYSRQSVGGCGLWNADATWANTSALPTINATTIAAIAQSRMTNVKTLNLSSAFNGSRLCEKGVGLYEEVGLSSWQQPAAVDKTEWINQIRTVTTAGSSPYYIQESLHPNYWGQLAIRSCLRQAYNAGTPRSGTCARNGSGLANGEPKMILQ